MRFTFASSLSGWLAAMAILCVANSTASAAPQVRINTVMGNIDIELLHEDAPLTVTNFLNYVVTDRYEDMFFHRSVPGFVVQGGGFTYPNDEVGQPIDVPADDSVLNEPGVSNTRGTVAMAKLGGQPNSATSEFFFNLKDNSEDLDDQNGGFTVFGRVVGSGMTVVDQIAALPRINVGGAFNTLPVRNFSGNTVLKQHLVIVNDVQVLPGGVVGDYNANGTVEQGDLDLVLLNWGDAAAPVPPGWFQGLPSGTIDQNELDGVLLNWGDTAGLGSPLVGANSVPEPAACLLLCGGALAPVAFNRSASPRRHVRMRVFGRQTVT
jgi:peptidyl-prolyl cis-trans isomerase A (cyclophilin A)